MNRARSVSIALVGVLPMGRPKLFLLRLLGYEVANTARISPCLLWNVRRLVLGESGRIGFGSVFMNLQELRIDVGSVIGQWNWISASSMSSTFPGATLQAATLSIGPESAVTSRHYLDCTGGILVGAYTTVAGQRSTFVTHGIDTRLNVQRARSIVIGDYCMIGSNVCVPPGTEVGDRSMVGMGSTISGELRSDGVYVQPRASYSRESEGEYFRRRAGWVGTHPGQGEGIL